MPAKTKQGGGVYQYNPKKTHKWGFKNLLRAGQWGIINDFFIYCGKNDNCRNPLTAKDIVRKLCKDIWKNGDLQLYFDN